MQLSVHLLDLVLVGFCEIQPEHVCLGVHLAAVSCTHSQGCFACLTAPEHYKCASQAAVVPCSDTECAMQVHLRHLVGGRARSFTGALPFERIFQVRQLPAPFDRHAICGECLPETYPVLRASSH